jgi:hypothetical protein
MADIYDEKRRLAKWIRITAAVFIFLSDEYRTPADRHCNRGAVKRRGGNNSLVLKKTIPDV